MRGRPKKGLAPKTQKQKTKNQNIFFGASGQKEEYVIRKRGYRALNFCNRKSAQVCVKKEEDEEEEEDVDGVG